MTARLRFVHAIPSSVPVNGILDGKVAITDFTYTSVSNYLMVNPGLHSIAVEAMERKPGEVDVLFAGVSFVLQADKYYTAFAVGSLAKPKQITFKVVEGDGHCPPLDKARIHFFHASSEAPAVDIYGGDKVVASNVSFGQPASFSPSGGGGGKHFLELDAGNVTVSVKLAGTSDTVVGPLVLPLQGGKSYTLVAVGIPGSAEYPLKALAIEDKKMCYRFH